MTMSGAIVSGITLGDVLKYVSHPAVCYASGLLKNATGTSLVNALCMGQPVKETSPAGTWEFVLTTDEANTEGILLHQQPITIANGTTLGPINKFLILKAGPAVINKDALPVLDVEGATLDPDAIAAALADLGITSQVEPTVQATIED